MTSEQQSPTTPAVPPARTAPAPTPARTSAPVRTSPAPAVPAARTAPAPARTERFTELLATVIHLLREVGYDRLTIDTVAARARVSKATIYRHWPGKPELVAAALHERHVDRHIPADTGSLRGDLLEMLRVTAAICTADSDLIQALTLAMRTAPELEKLIRHQVMPAGRVLSAAVIVRAAARGEIPPEAGERDLFHDLAPAMVMSRILSHGLPADDTFLTHLVDQVLLPVLRYHAG
ncbi:TetR/AcrR family transcriptional regulator [Micromonospora sp. NBC_01412]|uniref:TetR/AcrR family transcriptional regulator n=1 Tax=Micromonospora sp. NBC_01412 TaxID=2903590 RepID=UPI003243934E